MLSTAGFTRSRPKLTSSTRNVLILAAVALAMAAGAVGYNLALSRAPELAAAVKEDTRVTQEWIAELEAQAAGPTNRAEFCDMVLETAGDILWQEQMEFEAAATEAMHDVYGD